MRNIVAEVLSQWEIDQILTPIGVDISGGSFKNIEAFEDYLAKRTFTESDRPWGFSDEGIGVNRFFDYDKNKNLLKDIIKKNEEQGYGAIKIPNTNIMLINYSFCPNCKTIFSLEEITNYYMNPRPDQRYKNRVHQYRKDTRVYCSNCDIYFFPTLIISDGTPKDEVQFLDREETIDAVEKYFSQKNINVLTRNRKNIIRRGNLKAIKNDVFIKDLYEKPTLITNIIQYTPFALVMNLIDGTNVAKDDLLFDEWNKIDILCVVHLNIKLFIFSIKANTKTFLKKWKSQLKFLQRFLRKKQRNSTFKCEYRQDINKYE
jgi:hypothetical protein